MIHWIGIYLLANVLAVYAYSVYHASDVAWPHKPPNRWSALFWQATGHYYRDSIDGSNPAGWRSYKERGRYAKQCVILLFFALPIGIISYLYEFLERVL